MVKITLKAARVNAGFSQQQVAYALGVSNKTISSWERGLSVPNVMQYKKLCLLYAVSDESIIFLTPSTLKVY